MSVGPYTQKIDNKAGYTIELVACEGRGINDHQKSVVRLSNLEYHELPVRDIGALWPISSSAPFSASWTRQKISIGQP